LSAAERAQEDVTTLFEFGELDGQSATRAVRVVDVVGRWLRHLPYLHCFESGSFSRFRPSLGSDVFDLPVSHCRQAGQHVA
jgi:hypothetical protein